MMNLTLPNDEQLWDVLRTIDDPEMPISIVDLGLVERVQQAPDGRVEIDLLPTFVGCPALTYLEEEVTRQVARLPGVTRVAVRFRYSPAWSVERITDAGRERLRRAGITTPLRRASGGSSEGPELVALTVAGQREAPACPLCGGRQAELESAFGPTRCKMIYYCPTCRNSFEHMKRV
jgi:ring-1,2-phenylacetyl-CoA epoxidase subunit PaaD